MSFSGEWRRHHGPVGDAIEAFWNVKPTKSGYARALNSWNLLRDNFSSSNLNTASISARGLTPAQVQSVRLLEEWWDAKSQQKSLIAAARESLQTAASEDDENSSWSGYASREKAQLSESTYHSYMFILFEFEFLYEARQPLESSPESLNHTLHRIREQCSRLAALQRIAHEIIETIPVHESQLPDDSISHDVPLLEVLRPSIPVSIHPCPWLYDVDTDLSHERPHFLWDVRKQQTIVVSELPEPPEYVCVSHTWGRWTRDEVEYPPIRIPGVSWPIPQNSKFEVVSLPDQLERAFQTGYVWFDLLCIPQDGSVLGGVEISRQALIFRNANAVVAWLNDVADWRVMRDIVAWFALFYVHTNINIDHITSAVPDMPQPDEANYVGMELYDWTTGDVSFVPVINGVPVDENLKIAAPMPWFTSLWTLQEACFRPGLVLCDKLWRPLAINSMVVTMDALVALDNFVTKREFAKSVTRPRSDEESQASPSALPAIPSLSFPAIAQPPGCRDMTTLFIDTHIAEIGTISAAAIFTFGQFRECSSRRGEAIMAVVGATEWYVNYLTRHETAPPETDLVLDLYPLQFVQEAARKIGPTFFTSIPSELRYLQDVVDLGTGLWTFYQDTAPVAVGSMLPFSRSPGYFAPPVAPTQRELAHPAVKDWLITQDGSVLMKRAGILALGTEDQAEAIVHAPLYDEEDKVHYDTTLRMVDQVDLGGWLDDFSNPEMAPNFAVSLFQTPPLVQGQGAAMHTGLLLKCCGYDAPRGQMKLVKVGLFFTKAVDIVDVPSFEVDWVVL